MIAISIEQLTKRFGQTTALHRVNLAVEPGELFFLLGPSGCGKTTLLRCLAGFYMPDEGRVKFGADDVTGLPPHKRNTGMMFQSYALWPHMTVEQNVAFGLRERKVPAVEMKRRVGEALESVRMSAYASRSPNQLSGGQQQRVALARALVVRPRCLLLDEPLSNLDAKLRLEMRMEIRRVCKDFNLTTVYVTHDQKEALSISDRMAIMEAGHVLQVGSPRDVYARPARRTVANFIGETNFISAKLAGSAGDNVVVETSIGRFTAVMGDASVKPVPGSEVTVSIRPECWTIQRERPESNAVKGTIGECIYLGEVAQYDFNCGDTTIKMVELNPHFLGQSAQGELWASVEPRDVVVLTG